jgi:SsrA-binding protein
MNTITNKKLHHEYEIVEKYAAGIELFGAEVKSIRAGRVNLVGSKVIIRGGEIYVIGMDVQAYQENNLVGQKEKYDKLRTRKLLLKSKEIEKIYKILEDKHYSLIPYSVYDAHRLIKLDIALCKKLNKHDKREKIKERDFYQAG